MATFDFYFDIASPYSYLASTQLGRLEERSGASARLVPITLGGLRKTTGHQIPPASQLRYMAQDTARWAQRYGVPMQMPAAFPASTITALRTIVAAARDRRERDAMRALFHAYWAEGKDVSQAAVVEEALSSNGLDGKTLVAAAAEQPIKDALRAATDGALERGVFGVPTFFVGEAMFWGNDRMEFVEQALLASRQRAR